MTLIRRLFRALVGQKAPEPNPFAGLKPSPFPSTGLWPPSDALFEKIQRDFLERNAGWQPAADPHGTSRKGGR